MMVAKETSMHCSHLRNIEARVVELKGKRTPVFCMSRGSSNPTTAYACASGRGEAAARYKWSTWHQLLDFFRRF